MNAKDFNSANELPIGNYCYFITWFPVNTFAEDKAYFDSHNPMVYRKEMEEKYRNIVNQHFDFSLQYESAKLIKVKDGYFILEDGDGISHEGIREIFRSEEEMRAYWEQSVAAWKKAQAETAKYIKGMFPSISKAAQEIEAKHLERTWNLTDEEKQRIIEQY